MSSMHILKTRDDKSPIEFESASSVGQFELSAGSECSWMDAGEKFGADKLRPRIEPWLTALFQSEHLSLLAGSGLSNSVHGIATGTLLPGMSSATFTNYDAEISAKAKESSEAAGRAAGNIEDQLRVANELVAGLGVLSAADAGVATALKSLEKELEDVLKEFSKSILDGEKGLITAKEELRNEAFNYLVSFLMSFASRTGTRDRLQIFTTNYDRFIEAGADVAGLHLMDRFVGSLAPIFRSSRLDLDIHYNPPGIRGEPRYLEGVAKFSKLHGSMDWVNVGDQIRRLGVPFGADQVEPYLTAPGMQDVDARSLMIYPNAAKDRETSAYPYVELFRDFAAATCRPNSTLVTYGYSFGDEHINRVIEDMLTIPSSHLVIICRFNSKVQLV